MKPNRYEFNFFWVSTITRKDKLMCMNNSFSISPETTRQGILTQNIKKERMNYIKNFFSFFSLWSRKQLELTKFLTLAAVFSRSNKTAFTPAELYKNPFNVLGKI